VERIGPDTLHREGARVIVTTRREMPDWKPSSFRRAEVVRDGERLFVEDVVRTDDRCFRYVLAPWPDDLADRPSRSIVYDAEYVAHRDGGRANAWLGLLLWPFQTLAAPVLGCLWNATKQRLQARAGVNAGRATFVSVFCEYLAVLALGILAWLTVLDRSLVPVSPFAIFAAALALLADAAMRYDHLMDHPEDLLGVGEWLARFERGRRDGRQKAE
jgi:hypothetical protein